MTFSITIRTCTREVDYYKQTMQRLRETGTLDHPSVIGFHVSHGHSTTPNENGANALRRGASDNPDWVLFLEDDIDIIDDFIPSLEAWLEKFATPKCLVYPLGSFYPSITHAMHKEGVWYMPSDSYYGSQALVMRPVDALEYADYIVTTPWVAGFDRQLADWLEKKLGQKTVFPTPCPCFVDHLGEVSAVKHGNQTGRMLDFGGRNFRFRRG